MLNIQDVMRFSNALLQILLFWSLVPTPPRGLSYLALFRHRFSPCEENQFGGGIAEAFLSGLCSPIYSLIFLRLKYLFATLYGQNIVCS